eukprot:TRINITY_DN2188_c0_g1_i1.p1 TRINITY_DN2188_c0_g1~~TRINITY_DN2188_c0_g1_i1.p1  ORF type:complete len:333 (-),score=45.33 TRINITY_DN2188_c0_g1_i1:45-911(-)
MQLWMVTVYFADGLATAGTIVGSELTGQRDRAETLETRRAVVRDLRVMSSRLLGMGVAVGCVIAGVYWLFQAAIMDVFTVEEGTKAELRGVWLFLVLVQPLNALVFVYDGLIFAAQAFTYMAVCLSVGFLLLFLPAIGIARFWLHTLVAAWMAKAVLNVVRLAVTVYKIHFEFLAEPHDMSRSPSAKDPPPLLSSLIPQIVVVPSVVDEQSAGPSRSSTSGRSSGGGNIHKSRLPLQESSNNTDGGLVEDEARLLDGVENTGLDLWTSDFTGPEFYFDDEAAEAGTHR